MEIYDGVLASHSRTEALDGRCPEFLLKLPGLTEQYMQVFVDKDPV